MVLKGNKTVMRRAAGFSLSAEQQIFVETALKGKNILVDACIGSGKTTAIQHLCSEYPSNTRILYLTYNKLLKFDAKDKIRKKNVTVTNYHSYAMSMLLRANIDPGSPSEAIQNFIRYKPPVSHFDVLIIDEYQDIDLELSQMLKIIKKSNPKMQIVAVGDMQQKIYDRTTLKVDKFIHSFLGKHVDLEFTQCFRLPAEYAALLGRIWHKTIVGVNPDCQISHMELSDAVDFLGTQNPADVLCLGARTGKLAEALNLLESRYPYKYNKFNTYASISDNDSLQSVKPDKECAIFTTFDGSKGLERNVAVIFDFTNEYWTVRNSKSQMPYEILRNIFCVAASRGKKHIVFVTGKQTPLSEEVLATPTDIDETYRDVDISSMFDFKYKEDVEYCYSLLQISEIPQDDHDIINVQSKDGLIDLSPCIGIYQEASYFRGYNIDAQIEHHLMTNPDQKFLYRQDVRKSPVENKILFLTSLETHQNRYRHQVELPYIHDDEKDRIHKRLSSVLRPDEKVQKPCTIPFAAEKSGRTLFSAVGFADAVKDRTVYELKFVSELSHEHFLQCASYMTALRLKRGILWNVRDNTMYEIRIPNRQKFLDAVTTAVTKHHITKYCKPKKKKSA